jgi:hypothetical protein
MPKDQCRCYVSRQIHAFIYSFDKRNNILYVSQLPIAPQYMNPPIFEVNDEIELSFSLRNGSIYPHVRNLTNLFKVRVTNLYDVFNYKLRYKAKIVSKISDFYYKAEVIDSLH